jgi:two-component sensor histidine kinase
VSLRSKLILSFMAFASLLLMVGLTSLYLNRAVQADVAELRASQGVDFRHVDVTRVGLEVEGFWDPAGRFVASDVRVISGERRPKLRGAIQEIDTSGQTLTLYGVDISVVPETNFLEAGLQLKDLKLGQRIEVSSRVSGGHWVARKIKTEDVKASDKIKSTATRAELDGEAPETIWFDGIEVTVALQNATSPNGALRRVELATQMTLLLQGFRADAQRLVGRRMFHSGVADPFDLDDDTGSALASDEQLVRHEQSLGYYLEQSREAGGAQSSALAPLLHQLTEMRTPFREQLDTLQDLVGSDPIAARAFLDDSFDPFVQNDLLPVVYAYRTEAEEELASRLELIASRTETTTRLALATSGVAAILAVVLGIAVWRSIRAPIGALVKAALRLGQGHLDTRVEVRSRDEFGVLAQAFNQMADDLASTTLSVREKELLLREVHHRVKNNMQVISSLLSIQAGYTNNPQVREHFEQCQNRIRSMALIHEHLHTASSFKDLDMSAYLELLTTQLMRSSDQRIGLDLHVEPLSYDIDRAVACGLIVNELMSNALKHAFPEGGAGEIRVSLFEDSSGDRILSVEDNGRGFPKDLDFENLPGAGLPLVEKLAQQFDGKVGFDPEVGSKGTSVRIVFPASAVAA